jgi:2-hydroxy-6-oxonona-2,4-dienedioate hydrolase
VGLVTNRRLIIDGRPVHCRVLEPAAEPHAAIGRPLLLIHGLGCSSAAWGPALACLERAGLDQPVWAPDMPGYGHSPGPPEALGMAELADWSARLMDGLAIEQAHLAGNSMGCQVALALARRHPERVGGIVLAGPTTGERCESAWRYAAGLLIDGLREPMTYNGTLLRMYLQQGVRNYLATARQMLADDPLAHATEITVPCLVARGSRDAIVSEAAARRLVAALPRGRYFELQGAAHAVQFHRPEEFTRLLVEFLAFSAAAQPAPTRILGV